MKFKAAGSMRRQPGIVPGQPKGLDPTLDPFPDHLGAARERVCQAYWHLVCLEVQRRGHTRPDAEDLTQEFFAHLLRRDRMLRVDPQSGSYRSFVLRALHHFLINAWHRNNTLKRGGELTAISWEELPGNERLLNGPMLESPPTDQLDRSTATELIDRVSQLLRADYHQAGRGELFELLEPFLSELPQRGWYAQAAEEVGMNPRTLKVALHRLRRRFGRLVRQELARHRHGQEEFNEGIRDLLLVWNH